jgi:hypothetical protein
MNDLAMNDLARIEIERDVAEAAARRAAQAGLTVTAYVSLLLRRSFERTPAEERILAFDDIAKSSFGDGREAEKAHDWRSALDRLFGRRG